MNFTPESTAARRRDNRTDHQILFSPFTMVEATSSSYSGSSMLLDEEEDMANCLILLAQSTQKFKKSKNRRLTAITAGGKSKSGFQIYECKTCNRNFPSFQALGGHSASHKKLKPTIDEDRNSVSIIKTEFLEEHQPEVVIAEFEDNKIITNNIKSQIGFKKSKGKVHECSICGSEFLSGQALGGHMRRHRNQIVVSSSHRLIEKSPVLCLDLNLPAPVEVIDDVHSSNLKFTASSRQQSLVFPATALVDCHY